ncbi:MAG: ribulose-phosphate 3-epimerase [Verrucomicrobia bacterium]|nr:ribulose-phosphate 3-epimerase [Verrucomicrobiota bacterium]
MIKCSTSLWSADLTNLASETRRVESFSQAFHLDVADGHYTSTMLFFPDLVAQLRPHTTLPLEVHLMTTDPLAWIDPFVEAGADGFILCYDSLDNVAEVIKRVRDHGKWTGISLTLDESPELLNPYWNDLQLVTIIGTAIGIKGASMNASIPDKIGQARALIADAGSTTEVQADGGIRRNTVPLMVAAGADWIVPGSLMFKEDPVEMTAWLSTLEGPSGSA